MSEVEFKKHILLSPNSGGVTWTGKSKSWKEIVDVVNVISAVPRTMAEVKESGLIKKWRPKNVFVCTEKIYLLQEEAHCPNYQIQMST